MVQIANCTNNEMDCSDMLMYITFDDELSTLRLRYPSVRKDMMTDTLLSTFVDFEFVLQCLPSSSQGYSYSDCETKRFHDAEKKKNSELAPEKHLSLLPSWNSSLRAYRNELSIILLER